MDRIATWLYSRHPHRFALRAPMDYEQNWTTLPNSIKAELRGTAGVMFLCYAWGMCLCALGFFALGVFVGYWLCQT